MNSVGAWHFSWRPHCFVFFQQKFWFSNTFNNCPPLDSSLTQSHFYGHKIHQTLCWSWRSACTVASSNPWAKHTKHEKEALISIYSKPDLEDFLDMDIYMDYVWILVFLHCVYMDLHMIPVFTFHCLDFIIPSEDGYVKTHSSWSTARGRVLKNLQGWADVESMNSNKPILFLETFLTPL